MDINQVILAVGAICAAVILVGGAANVIRKWVSPLATMKEDIAKLKENNAMTNEGIGVLCRCVLAFLRSVKPENDATKRAEEELQNYLTKF